MSQKWTKWFPERILETAAEFSADEKLCFYTLVIGSYRDGAATSCALSELQALTGLDRARLAVALITLIERYEVKANECGHFFLNAEPL